MRGYIFAAVIAVLLVIPATQSIAVELPNDSNTQLMLRYNGSLSGEDGESSTGSTGTSYTSGLIDQAVHTGNPGYVRYSNTDNIISTQGTVEFWICPDWNGDDDSTTHNFFQVGYSFNNGMIISIDGGNNLRFIQWGDDPDTPGVETNVERGFATSGASWTAGLWYHVAATWDSTTREMGFYINGAQKNWREDGVVIDNFSATDFFVGSKQGGGQPAEAAFDELRIYDRARTEGEILDDYHAGLDIIALNNPRGVAVNSSDWTYVVESGANQVSVFDANGTKLSSFGSPGSGDGEFDLPWDIATDQSDNIYVVDSGNDRIQVFNSTGTYLDQFGASGTGTGQFNSPKGIYYDIASNKIYIADTGNHRVQRFDSSYAIDTSWGTGGIVGTTGVLQRDNTGFDGPTDIAISTYNGKVYISDYGNHRLELFDSSGNYIRSRMAVYRPNSLAISAAGNIYVAGEDPNNSYTFFDGRLRLLEAGKFLLGKHYTGGLDDIDRIQGGVAIRGDGAIIFTDTLNNRLVKTDSSFTEPITDLEILPNGESVTFRWKTEEPGPGSIRYGTTSSYGSEVTDATVTTDHEVVATGLIANTRLYYGVSFPDSFNGTQYWTPQDILNTGPQGDETQFLRLKCAGMIYLDTDSGAAYNPMNSTQLQAAYDRYDMISRFYWINSGFKLWLDYTVIEIDRNLTSPLWIWSSMESDLTAAGYSAVDDFDAVHAACHCANGNYGGGGTLFGRSVGACHWVTQSDFVPIHEINHSVDSIYNYNGLKKYEFNHGIWAVPNGLGDQFSINGQILRNMYPANYTATKSPYTKVMTAPDMDYDGLPDSSPAGLTSPLSVTEATLGSSTASADTDNDGMSDLEEAMALIYHWTDLNSDDSDGDGVTDGNDLNPAYTIKDHIGRGSPNINGIVTTSEGWTAISDGWGYSNDALVSDNDNYQGLTTIYAAWDNNYMYLALKGPSTTATVELDGSADNVYMNPDNYFFTLRNGYYSRAVKINVGVPDIFRQIDNDGQWSNFFDTSAMWTNPWQGRTLYNNPEDGFGFSARLVTEADLVYSQGGSGNDCVWELAIPWSTKTLFEGHDGKMMAIYIELSGDVLFESSHAAKIKLVDIGAPEITGISYSAGIATLTFNSVPGTAYNVYYKDDIDDTWVLIEQVIGQGDGTEYVDDGSLTSPAPADAASRFYRIGV